MARILRGEIRWADLAVERIGARLGRASPEETSQVVEGLNEIIGI